MLFFGLVLKCISSLFHNHPPNTSSSRFISFHLTHPLNLNPHYLLSLLLSHLQINLLMTISLSFLLIFLYNQPLNYFRSPLFTDPQNLNPHNFLSPRPTIPPSPRRRPNSFLFLFSAHPPNPPSHCFLSIFLTHAPNSPSHCFLSLSLTHPLNSTSSAFLPLPSPMSLNLFLRI